MRNLPATLCLTLVVLLFSPTEGWSADFEKGLDAYDSGDYATALREWKPLAEQGDAKSQYNMGNMYEKGKGVPQDYETTVKFWNRLAAEQGKGVPKNNNIAVLWWTRAAKQGRTNALFYKGLLYLLGPG